MTKQDVIINFQQGLNTKTDPWQLPIGQFINLENMIFQKGGQLQKRNGYGLLSAAPAISYLTTFNGGLVGIGNSINSYAPNSMPQWVSKGNFQPCSVTVTPIIRNNFNQTQTDAVIANGFICTTFSNSSGHFYAVEVQATGQNIISPTAIPVISGGSISGSSRVFLVQNYFVIVSQVTVSGTTYLQYFSIPIFNISAASVPAKVYTDAYVPISGNPGWDGVVTEQGLLIAYNTTSGAQGIDVTFLTEQTIGAGQTSSIIKSFSNAAYIGAIVSVCVDTVSGDNTVYISFYNSTTFNGYTCAVTVVPGAIQGVFNPTQIFSASSPNPCVNIASSAQLGICTIFYEISNKYSYDSSIPTNYIKGVTINVSATVGSTITSIRSVGLASKAFIINSQIFYFSAYQSPFQPTYFLINASMSTEAFPVIVAKIAYQGGGGYVTAGLPSVTVSGSIAYLSYLFKQNIQALNVQANTQQSQTGGIYSQLGINFVSFDLATKDIVSAEIGQNLHLSGGYLSMFDGFYPVEHNFFLFPDSIEATWSSSGGNMGPQPDGSTNTNAYYYIVTYEWTDMQGNLHQSGTSIAVPVTTTGTGKTGSGSVTITGPMLRLTSKILVPPKVVIYRWSVGLQTYFQITSFTNPLSGFTPSSLNDTTVDSWSYLDVSPDNTISGSPPIPGISGNNILYTTGGVQPNFNAPACDIITTFDTRLVVVSAEDDDLIYISKQVNQGVPADNSPFFGIYISPNVGTTSSTGFVTAAFPMDDKLILFKQNSIFFMNGTGPNDLGSTAPGSPLGNYSQPIFITSVVGCENQQSIVLTADGLMFQSDKGIWLLRRDLATIYIGAPVEQYNNSTVTSAQVIPGTNYVVFTLNTGQTLMYDYYYKQWGLFIGNPTVSSCIYAGYHTLLDQYGRVLQETPGVYLDATRPVLMSFTTSWLNLATIQGYERFYYFYFLGNYLSPHFLNVQIAYDYNPSIFHNTLVAPKNFSSATAGPFGIPTSFGSPIKLEQGKIHTLQQLCQSMQISVSEVYDSTKGVPPGAGFTMSGLTCRLGIKKAQRPISGENSFG